MIRIDTDFIPPGVNNLFVNVNGRGRVRSKRYREWALAAGYDFNGHGSLKGPVEVAVTLNRAKIRKGSDLDGKLKAPLDLLVTHGIIEDDSLINKITLAYGDVAGMRVEIWPYVGGAA